MGLKVSKKYSEEIKDFENKKCVWVYVPVADTKKSSVAQEKAEGICALNEESDLSDPDDTINRACIGNNIPKARYRTILIDRNPKGSNIVIFNLE